ncbi:MAG: hypothetical protein P1U38_09805 [Aeromicrobium sp.]|uniref:hypothetical protein n=1 Tax=Aeromicrobium sp. TaxID=1871063 RepID=UPI002622F148|nr:hypothetical protein [Aeromicrobium sp.]MDF1705056.1 hypothetical protein [Aeromicrobium sp.]
MSNVHFLPPGFEPVPTEPDLYDRAEAAQFARDILLVKGGKYAERQIDVWDLIHLAEWLMNGPEEPEEPGRPEWVSDGFCECEDCQ